LHLKEKNVLLFYSTDKVYLIIRDNLKCYD
jgi:hypothetical protein